MRKAEFDHHVQLIIDDILSLREAGQKEYAHGEVDNVFNNFIRVSNELGIPKEKVLWTYFRKHLDGIVAHMNGHVSQREPVHGRVKDAIVYLILLDAMFVEAEQAIDPNVRRAREMAEQMQNTYPSQLQINARNAGLGARSDLLHDRD